MSSLHDEYSRKLDEKSNPKRWPTHRWRVNIMTCPECGNDILSFGRAPNAHPASDAPYSGIFFPQGSSRGPVSSDVPGPIAADYGEAAKVLPDSPKASAALARRCLQAILREAGYKQRDLAVQIDAVLGEADARKARVSALNTVLQLSTVPCAGCLAITQAPNSSLGFCPVAVFAWSRGTNFGNELGNGSCE